MPLTHPIGVGSNLFNWACVLAMLAGAAAGSPRSALAVCADPDPVYLDSDAQGSHCTPSLQPVISGGGSTPFVLTARSSIDSSAPTDPDASGSPGTVKTSDKGAGVESASCSGSKGISGKGGDKDEELIFTLDDALLAACVVVGFNDIEISCSNDRPVLVVDAGQD
jgi:hypothetical protein